MKQRKSRTPPVEPAAVVLERTMQRLDELSRLEEDWDSYEGYPPTEVAVATAKRLIAAVAERVGSSSKIAVEPVFTAPISSGGVQFEWEGPRVELEVVIGPSGSLGYLLVTGVGEAEDTAEEHDVAWSRMVELTVAVLNR